MAAVTARSIGTEICEVLGLDPMKTGTITMEFRPHEVVIAVAHLYVQQDEAERIKEVLTRYTLVPKDDG